MRTRNSATLSDGAKAADEAKELSVSGFERGIDWEWRRTSFSDISANAWEPRVASEPEETWESDEPVRTTALPIDGDGHGQLDVASPFAAIEGGVRFGTFAHRVLQSTDFAASDLDQEIRSQVQLERSRTDLSLDDPKSSSARFAVRSRPRSAQRWLKHR